MALTLIFGEAGTGKSEYCLQTMLTYFKKGIPSILIVPEQFAHSAESRLLKENGFLSDDIAATSFKRLAYKTLHQTGKLHNTISKIGKSMLLSRSVLQNADNLTLYKNSAGKPGFIDAMLTFISECKRSEILPENLLNIETDNPYFTAKIADLAKIYESYQSALQAGYTDSDEYLTYLADYLKNNPIYKGNAIFIDEFFRFTPAELDCILALLLSGSDVYITLGASSHEAGGVFEPVSNTAKVLMNIAKKAGITMNPPVFLKEKHRFANAPELAHFEGAHHHHSPAFYPEPTKNISLYIAPDPYTEIQVLAANICRTVKENGYHFRDIAIIAGNPELYADLIQTVFPVYDIPVFIDRKHSLLSHPIIIMLFSLFDLMAKGIETETLLAYCKTGYSGLTREETDILENFALAGRLRRKDWLDDVRFLQRADSVFYRTENFDETDTEQAQKLLDIRNRLLKPLLSLRDALAESRLVRDRAASVFTFFEEIALLEKVEAEMQDFKEKGELQQASEHGEIYNLLITLLDELVQCLGSEKIGMKRLTNILSAGLSQCEISTIPPGNDHVFFGDVSRSLVKNVKELFVIGLNDGSFPPSAPQEGILKDDERLWLSKNGIEVGPDSQKIVFHNQYLMYNALSIAHSRTTFSYPVADLEGKGLRPAPLAIRLKKIFPHLSVSDNLTEALRPEQVIAGKASAWQYLLEHFNEKTPLITTLKKYFENDPAYERRYIAMLQSARYTHRVENLSPHIANALYGKRIYSSVSRLEKYASCPFSYFIHHGLKAKERKILKIDAPDIGTLLHDLIERVSRQITAEGKSFASLDDETITRLADETVSDLLSSLFIAQLYSENRLSALIRRLKNSLAKMLQVISKHVARGLFEPCAFEVAFSENGELAPVTINLPTGETITLTGRIDRIDMLKQNADLHIRVIDYKTGKKDFHLYDVYSGLSLQLAIYLTAITEGGEKLFGKNPKPAGMFYFRLADQTIDAGSLKTENDLLKQFKMKGMLLRDVDMVRAMDKGIDGSSFIIPANIKKDGSLSDHFSHYATYEQFQKLSSYVRRVAGEIGREIMQGKIAISPCKTGKSFPCNYCRFHSICGFDPEKDSYRISYPLKDDVFWSLLENDETNA